MAVNLHPDEEAATFLAAVDCTITELRGVLERAASHGATPSQLDLIEQAADELTVIGLPIYERLYGDDK